MFDAFWNDFKWKIFAFCFLPYLFYFLLSFGYLSNMLFQTGEEAKDWEFYAEDISYIDTYELPLRWIFMVFLVYFIFIEVK